MSYITTQSVISHFPGLYQAYLMLFHVISSYRGMLGLILNRQMPTRLENVLASYFVLGSVFQAVC